MIKRGLTLGKYAPFHKGHQFVIETALAEMDDVQVIIYDAPETTLVPLDVRAQWIRYLYPTVQVIEAWDGPTAVGATAGIQQAHEDYILNRLNVGNISHFYSSEFYGDHMAKALGAINRQVDTSRQKVPISGTAIRADPYLYRHFLDPVVYRDLIMNVVFLGAPSTGKTTLAERMAQEYHSVWMPEYGREYWETHQINRRLNPEQLVKIAEGHLQREDALIQQANHYLFTDTNAITTYMFARVYHGYALPRLSDLAVAAASRYDLVFLCDTDIPYADTWDRSGDVNRQVFQKQIVSDLIQRKVLHFTLRGDLETRVQRVKTILEKFEKYRPLASIFNES